MFGPPMSEQEPIAKAEEATDSQLSAGISPDLGSTEPASPKGSVILGLLRTMRPHQWVKNSFVLAPLFFAKGAFQPEPIARAFAGMGLFCLLAGAVYCMNDLMDVEADRLHPVKRNRPIAKGQVPESIAKLATVVLLLAAISGGLAISWAFLLTALSYFVLNLAYSLKLKKIAYLDVGVIALGFVLRVLGGGFATGVHVTPYLFACTALLALFLGFGKRRHELSVASAKSDSAAKKQRKALDGYTEKGLDVALALTSVFTFLTYLAYSLDEKTQAFFQAPWLWMTSIFVFFGVWRFFFLVRNRPDSESPTQEMLSDGPFVANILLWIAVMGWAIYQLRPGA